MEGCAIADVLAANGVQGRGGAAYDMGNKWRQAREVPAPPQVCSVQRRRGRARHLQGPGASHQGPLPTAGGHDHRRLGRGGGQRIHLLREEYSHLRPQLLSAIEQCEAAGYLGDNILGPDGSPTASTSIPAPAPMSAARAPPCAESIGGPPGRPRMKPPFIKQCGVFHLPTCVNNVESLSLVAPLLLDDEGYYKSQGTPDCPGTKMISVCGNVKRPGVFEVPFGITIREIVYDLAGGMENGLPPALGAAWRRVGPHLSPAELDTPYTYKGMRQADLTAIGSGAVLVVDERTSVIGFLRMTQQFFCHESCGQCTPCREGNRHISLLLDKVAEGTHTAQDIATLKKFADIMSSASLCGLGETAQSALLSCMKRFPEVFAVKEEVAVR